MVAIQAINEHRAEYKKEIKGLKEEIYQLKKLVYKLIG
jgi:hypothetical protein